MRPHPDARRAQLRYLLPAIELRRLLGEARAAAESFSLTYRRVSVSGAPFDGHTVTLVERQLPDGRRKRRCTVRRPTGLARWLGAQCAPDEIGLLPASDWWLSGLLLAFPLPMQPDGQRELGCLA